MSGFYECMLCGIYDEFVWVIECDVVIFDCYVCFFVYCEMYGFFCGNFDVCVCGCEC